MPLRSALSGAFAVGLTLGLTPLGCGGAQEGSYVEHRSQPTELVEAPSAPTVPEAIVEKLRGCVRQNAGDLTTYSHETRFDVSLTAEGTISLVKLRSSTLQSGVMESCMMRALMEMSVDPLSLPMRSSKPFSGGERMEHSREPLGIAQALAGPIALGPLILIAAGVTVGVYIAVAVTEEVIEAAKRNRRINQMCQARLDECVANPWHPPENWEFWGKKKQCEACFGYCLDKKYWPEDKCPGPGYRPPGIQSN
jgi:hypothetical protein